MQLRNDNVLDKRSYPPSRWVVALARTPSGGLTANHNSDRKWKVRDATVAERRSDVSIRGEGGSKSYLTLRDHMFLVTALNQSPNSRKFLDKPNKSAIQSIEGEVLGWKLQT
jgi:hypothetical protein